MSRRRLLLERRLVLLGFISAALLLLVAIVYLSFIRPKGQPFSFFLSFASSQSACLDCHKQITPTIAKEWSSSKHSKTDMACADCHGQDHTDVKNVARAQMPTADTCGACHSEKYEEFKAGKHAVAWKVVDGLERTVAELKGSTEKWCGGCHDIGRNGGNCSACHSQHTFSVEEARKPQACAGCHSGVEHPSQESWAGSQHGLLYVSEGEGGRGPACQTCHMNKGNHRVMTAWGTMALRVEEDDKDWKAYRGQVFKALGLRESDLGMYATKMSLFQDNRVMRNSRREWEAEREGMLEICSECHSKGFAEGEMQKADLAVKDADALVAQGAGLVESLYNDGLVPRPNDSPSFPDVRKLWSASSDAEQALATMLLVHRLRVFSGAMHLNPSFSYEQGWADLEVDLKTVREATNRLRKSAGLEPVPSTITMPAPGEKVPQKYFPETGHTVGGDFLTFWQNNGGDEIFGKPLTEEVLEQGVTVQYFEKARFEYHPGNPDPYKVLLGELGLELTRGTDFGSIPPFENKADKVYFDATSHSLGGAFLEFWQAHNGLLILGFPISEELEKDGLTFQYFQRGLLEYHPDRPAPERVQITKLGTEALRQKGQMNNR